jgi:hypothetical protein
MRKMALSAAAAASIALSGCASNPAYEKRVAGTAEGAAVVAGVGAVAGSILPGVGTATGADAGSLLGGVLVAVVNGHQYYRDTRGYCYYVDANGQPHYSYNVRC